MRKIVAVINEEAQKVIAQLKAEIDEKVSKIELDELNRRFVQLSNDVETGKANDISFNEFMSKFTSLTARLDERVKLIEDPTIENAYVRQKKMDAFNRMLYDETEKIRKDHVNREEFVTWRDQMGTRLSDSLANTVKSEQLRQWQEQMSKDATESRAVVDGRIDS